MHNGLRGAQRQGQVQRVDPRLIVGSRVLQLSQAELAQAIDAELIENPALERVVEDDDRPTREEIIAALGADRQRTRTQDYEATRSLPPDDRGQSWIELTPSEDSLHDHLRGQLLPRLPTERRELGEYLVGCVNDQGYLECQPEEAALACGCSLECAQEAIEHLQACQPQGVGARDLRECLELQLRDAEEIEGQFAHKILLFAWEELVARKSRAIARKFKASDELVASAFERIIALNPYPGQGFSRSSSGLLFCRSVAAVPELVLSRAESGWIVEVPGSSPVSLRVSSFYESRKSELAKMHRPDRAEARHFDEYIERANKFIDALAQRRQTLLALGKCLVERQAGFIDTGEYLYLKSLTKSAVAKQIGVHESTVSRATKDKFVQIATGEVVPFDAFFKPALRVQKMIEEILQHESPNAPMSDERIAEMLAEKGVEIARRTVNKYRNRRRLLNSRHRRPA